MLAAETVCRQRNMRLTPARKQILKLVCSSHKTVGAYELLDRYRALDPKAKPATIYRALDFLAEAGLVHKVESLNAFFACMQAETEHHTAVLICDQCHNVAEIEAEKFYEKLFTVSKSHEFKPKRLLLELHGVCAECQE